MRITKMMSARWRLESDDKECERYAYIQHVPWPHIRLPYVIYFHPFSRSGMFTGVTAHSADLFDALIIGVRWIDRGVTYAER